MASEDRLTIHKLVFDLRVDDKNAYTHFANRFSNLCNNLLPRKLEQVLKKHELPNGKLIIKKLEIDLGKIRPHLFESTIADAISDQLDLYLKQLTPSLKSELSQAKFKSSGGQRFSIKTGQYEFESEIYLPEAVSIDRAVSAQSDKAFAIEESMVKTLAADPKSLKDLIGSANREDQEKTSSTTPSQERKEPKQAFSMLEKLNAKFPEEIKNEIKKAEKLSPSTPTEATKIQKLKPSAGNAKDLLKQVQALEKLPEDLPSKPLTELDQALLYYLRYGRLPSNIKYELGMRMQDVFNITQRDIRFFKDLKRQLAKDERAKERLMRLSDEKNQQSLVRKEIFKAKEVNDFDPRIPKSFEDYLVALFFDRDVSSFSPALQRYSLNDMVRFFYTDHPQKLKAILSFLLKHQQEEETLHDRISAFFDRIGKSSIVKIIASFARKAGHVNKMLNRLNKVSGVSVKESHAIVLEAFITGQDPIALLKSRGLEVDESADHYVEIRSRVFLKQEPEFSFKKMTNAEIVDYYLTNNALPHSSLGSVPSVEKLSVMIILLNEQQLKDLPFFQERKYEERFDYHTIGALDLKAIEHILKKLTPDLANDLFTKFKFFQVHLKSGVPLNFQKAFLLYYALRNKSVSYLEEMINYWKKQFGDADQVIAKRWKVSDDIRSEFNKVIKFKEETVEDLLKVDYEFQNYSQDISVKNAGLVILWPFLKVYFNMLELLDPKGDFRSMEERARACHLLQYLAVKQAKGEELYYPLNKILTGYPLDEPLPYEITMTEKEIDVSNALLKNVIKQWNALKGGSVDALRGSFLIRDGVLVPAPNGWLLTVEKKAYDILMDKLPWGIGMIKLSWAPYILSVEWERNIM